ncbi:hypothetical protein Ppb6_02348 [Photorhabdus australis subsp. thailandensis]|uniref:Radical SAM core domain-containing protein n=1 Tax=Photorhabdus australis subsp. thailandensis TaxID=2805096 RepID=A0A1C0U319_9GAMM|nr:hypothetical protein [Photorhabdus australis]OCQ52275.1 hypothetical protein Ppb6_02348 [Photorhabdus australis subsp. thailandensis]
MSNQHHVVKNILKWLSSVNNKINIKLTTVVSNSNIGKLHDIISWVNRLPYNVQSWRFYQFCPLGVGKEKREKLEIDEHLFLSEMRILKRDFPDVPISWATFEERDKANIIMEPNFDIIIPDGDNYTLLCNMRNDDKEKILASIFGNPIVVKNVRIIDSG